ncbi:hypothetical protein OAJ42_00205 [Flavobacteriales bacterium]|nr:hypothetical protein [Flavobacteriales bacterium]
MLDSKSKKIGFVGTIIFHLFLFIVCFFSTLAYTSSDINEGVEITYLSYEDSSENTQEFSEKKTDQNALDENQIVENLITEKSDLVNINTDNDTVTISEIESIVEEPTISSELENAFLKINQSQTFENNSIQMDHNTDISSLSGIEDVTEFEAQDGYSLSDNRFAVNKCKPKYLCKETGRVVVRVWVNREGVTIKAIAGIRGTTESASCLIEEAQVAALKTTWTPYLNAPETQIGQITYNFYNN